MKKQNEFMKKMRKSIAETITEKYKEINGSIPEKIIKEIKICNLENILFDRIKNQNINF